MKPSPPQLEKVYSPEEQAELAARVALPDRADGELCMTCSWPCFVQSGEARESATFDYLNRIHHPGHRPHERNTP